MSGTRIALGIVGAGIMGERLLRGRPQSQVRRHRPRRRRLGPVGGGHGSASPRPSPTCRGSPTRRPLPSPPPATASISPRRRPRILAMRGRRSSRADKAVFCEKPLAVDVARTPSAFVAAAVQNRRPRRRQFPLRLVLRGRPALQRLDRGRRHRQGRSASSIEIGFAAWPRPMAEAMPPAGSMRRAQGGFAREVGVAFPFPGAAARSARWCWAQGDGGAYPEAGTLRARASPRQPTRRRACP